MSDPSSLEKPARGRPSIRPTYNPETFGKVSERVARFLGSWRFIAWMSILILAWVIFNVVATDPADPYPFIFLTLLLSLQASYAAPLILLAQNRQDDRDRIQIKEDRERTERLIADTEYLAREIAALRIGLGEVVTRDYLRRELRALLEDLEHDEA
ncbi:MAG: DUF1003 domain-containing protein [Actinobacteria bacterium]|nr:MAG: DUF1003 domain-containing protein [Actinomycetota bacterium]